MRAPMTPSVAPRARGGVVLGAAAVMAGAAFFLAVRALGWGQVVLHQCVPGDGPLGVLGLRLALLRTSAVCGDGSLAVGPGGGVVASIALGTLLLHVTLLGGGLGLTGLLARAWRSARSAVLAALPALLLHVRAVLVPGRPSLVVEGVPASLARPAIFRGHPRRGPPLLAR